MLKELAVDIPEQVSSEGEAHLLMLEKLDALAQLGGTSTADIIHSTIRSHRFSFAGTDTILFFSFQVLAFLHALLPPPPTSLPVSLLTYFLIALA